MHVSGSLFLTAPTVDAGVPGPAFEPAAAGPYFMTVSARGRDRQYDAHVMPDPESAEQYRTVIAAYGA